MTEFATRAIHTGQDPDPHSGSVIVPIHATSTFAQDGVGQLRNGYEYSRGANPTRTALETCLAALEGGRFGRAFASGMAATDVLLRAICRPGDHLVIPDDAYGGTFRLIDKVLRDWGIEYTAVSQSDLGAVRAAMRPTTRVLWCETPSNPLLGITDLATLAGLAQSADALLVVDNTFATPYLQRPLAHGADVVVHSMTKYLGGHSDVVAGALVTADVDLGQRLAFAQNAIGSV
ncbi:MAG TPA: aminotransferase class I/II-fold pyridoxal phosphate-dependent enzyme, partial [Pseudonocardiaceae bacterium]|nr:aminotransferase class I/II-fold pyridoxal phosphate-dependent enzyme [Pseudonocardiaceae bacterium]